MGFNSKDSEIESLTDDEILAGFRNADERVVKEYFYGYCRVAYCLYAKRYALGEKPGMDFYSLAHEYYLALCKGDFRQLENRNPQMSLKTWMVNGFRFLLLDKLKTVEKERRMESLDDRMRRSRLGFDVSDNEFSAEFRRTIDDICLKYYGRDNKNSIILQMLFVEGFKGKEIAAQLGMSPSAVTQRYNKLMHDVIVPYFKEYFVAGEYESAVCTMADIEPGCVPMSGIDTCEYRGELVMEENWKNRVTPEWIDKLAENEVFVFGSNLEGMHGGGAARVARLHFGAKMGQGVGLQGQSYAIPTMQGGVDTIRPYVDEFIGFAKAHPELRFLVTPIGCGIAGFEPEDIATLFEEARGLENVFLPLSFWEEIM